jgi:hypothetical protein
MNMKKQGYNTSTIKDLNYKKINGISNNELLKT